MIREKKVRKFATRLYPTGTIFIETDGHYMISMVERVGNKYNYTLEKLTPDEVIVTTVMDS